MFIAATEIPGSGNFLPKEAEAIGLRSPRGIKMGEVVSMNMIQVEYDICFLFAK